MIAFKAHFDGKVIVPDEPVKLPTNRPLAVRVELARSRRSKNVREDSVLEWLVENAVADDSLPADLAYQHDHYLYGTPKKKDLKL